MRRCINKNAPEKPGRFPKFNLREFRSVPGDEPVVDTDLGDFNRLLDVEERGPVPGGEKVKVRSATRGVGSRCKVCRSEIVMIVLHEHGDVGSELECPFKSRADGPAGTGVF